MISSLAMPWRPGRPARILISIFASLGLAAAGLSGSPATSSAATGDDEALIAVIEAAGPAVVSLRVSGAARFGLPDGLEDVPAPQVPISGAGSGVIIDPDGLIITNGHVVEGADKVSVSLTDGRVFEGQVVGTDTLTDFAFVRVEAAEALPVATMGDSSSLRVGQRAIVIGDPLGRFPGSVSVGIVSGLDRSISIPGGFGSSTTRLRHLIQTDAAINPGNSGGAILDGDGELVGITTAQAGMADGIGFGLPIDLARPIIEQVRAGEPIARPWLGVMYLDIDAQLAEAEGLPVRAGAWLGSGDPATAASPIVSGSPADQAGLAAGDIIVAVDGEPIDARNPLDLVLLRHLPGDQIALALLRDGEELEVEVTLGTRPADLGR